MSVLLRRACGGSGTPSPGQPTGRRSRNRGRHRGGRSTEPRLASTTAWISGQSVQLHAPGAYSAQAAVTGPVAVDVRLAAAVYTRVSVTIRGGIVQFSTKLASLIISALAALGLTVLAAPAASAQSAPQGNSNILACPDNDWQTLDRRDGYYIRVNGARIRTGPSTACTGRGSAYRSDLVELDCTRAGWTHLYVYRTTVEEWVRNDLLTTPANRACT